ncbi:protein CCSMST1 [Suncus etruscus]|uniref:protein CCSMST1 n=1 Tax=Suncus etruscus TaxID=109475 RepID=UPI0021100EEF|nr:protein CCSMST1 [Suncus etruscus]
MTRALCAPAAGAVRALVRARWAARNLHHPRPASRARAGGARASVAGEEEDDPDHDRPIQFSSSRASPSRWTVEHSLGREQQRPWWRVLPFSLALLLLIGWCFVREETSTDSWLRRILEEEEPEPRGSAGSPAAAPGART